MVIKKLTAQQASHLNSDRRHNPQVKKLQPPSRAHVYYVHFFSYIVIATQAASILTANAKVAGNMRVKGKGMQMFRSAPGLALSPLLPFSQSSLKCSVLSTYAEPLSALRTCTQPWMSMMHSTMQASLLNPGHSTMPCQSNGQENTKQHESQGFMFFLRHQTNSIPLPIK